MASNSPSRSSCTAARPRRSYLLVVIASVAMIILAASTTTSGLVESGGRPGWASRSSQASVLQSLMPQQVRHATAITSLPPAQRGAAIQASAVDPALDSLTTLQQAQLESYQQAVAQLFGITPGGLAGPAGGPLTLAEIHANLAELFRSPQ